MVSLLSLTPSQLREVSYYHQMVVEVFALCLGFAHMGDGEAITEQNRLAENMSTNNKWVKYSLFLHLDCCNKEF